VFGVLIKQWSYPWLYLARFVKTAKYPLFFSTFM